MKILRRNKSKIHWDRVDRLLIETAVLPERRRRKAMEKIAKKEDIHFVTLYDRCEYLGIRQIHAKMGPRAVAAWLRHMRQLVDLYKCNIRIHYAVMNRYEEVLEDEAEFLKKTYSRYAVAKLLGVAHTTIDFWQNVIGALQVSEDGRFTGAELRRFWHEDKYLLVAARALQWHKGKGYSRPVEPIKED